MGSRGQGIRERGKSRKELHSAVENHCIFDPSTLNSSGKKIAAFILR